MDLLLKYAYPCLAKGSYAKFIIVVSVKVSERDDIGFSLGKAIVLTRKDGSLIPKGNFDSSIKSLVLSHAEKYETARVTALTLQIFVEGKVENVSSLSLEERVKCILESKDSASLLKEVETIIPRPVGTVDRITALKTVRKV